MTFIIELTREDVEHLLRILPPDEDSDIIRDKLVEAMGEED